MARMAEAGQTGVYAENAFNGQNGMIPLYPLELNGRLCAEIDNPDDLASVGERFQSLLAAERSPATLKS